MNASGPAAETTTRPAESAEKTERWAGQNVPRREDRRLLQGQGEFTDDYLAQPAPDPAQFGMPAEDDGSRDDPLLSERSWAS